jgi:hypothetical protein
MGHGVAQPQAEELSLLAKEAGKDLGFYLEQVAAHFENIPKEKLYTSKGGYIYAALRKEFNPNLFDDVKKIVSVSGALRSFTFTSKMASVEPPEDEDPTWTGIKNQMAGELPENEFDSWVKPLKFRREGDGAVLFCPNAIFGKYLIERHGVILQAAFDRAGLTFTLEDMPSEKDVKLTIA